VLRWRQNSPTSLLYLVCKRCSTSSLRCVIDFHYPPCRIVGWFDGRYLESDKMLLGKVNLLWLSSIKFLSVHVVMSKKLSFDTDPTRQASFPQVNCINAQARSLDEIIHSTLQDSFCLSTSTYANAAIKLNGKQEDNFNSLWNSVYRRIFPFNKWECSILINF
jgi:hypothetical protein